jgi:hypothetical protein
MQGNANNVSLPESGEIERRADEYTPDKVDRFLIGRVESRLGDAVRSTSRWALERMWFENILFYLGIQWLDWLPNPRRFVPMNAPKWFPKPVTNEVYPRVERLMSQFLKASPVVAVRPNTNEPSDREAAKVGEQLCAHIAESVNDEDKLTRCALGLTLTGTVVSREWFDPNIGPIIEIPETTLRQVPVMDDVAECPACGHRDSPEAAMMPCPMCQQAELVPSRAQAQGPDGGFMYDWQREQVADALGQPIVHRFHQGEIQSEVIYPFEFYMDPKAETLEKAEWCGHVSYRDLEWIRRTFPDKARYVQEESNNIVSSFYQEALLQVVGQSSPGSETGGQRLTGGALVMVYEERPSEAFPKGLCIITASKVLLYEGPLPLESEFSYTLCQYSPVPGRAWGTTPVEQIVPLNRRLNGLDSQVIINRKTMLNPTILAPKGSGIKPGQIGYRPGAVIEYNFLGGGGVAPQIVPGVSLPAQIMQEREQILDAIERIAGTQDVLRGDVPPGVKSGVALNFLGEQAEMMHLPRAKRWERFIAARAKKRLILAAQHYREERIVKVNGAGSTWQVRRLTGSDLRYNTDVTVEAGSSLPRSRTAQIQLLFDAMQEGLFGDVVNNQLLRQQVLEEIGLLGFQTEIGPDHKRALVENAKLDQGVMPEVDPLENSDIHYKIHLAEYLDPRFDDKPAHVQALYREHIMATRWKIIQEIQQQLPAEQPTDPNQQQANGGGEGQPTGAPQSAGAPPAGTPPPEAPVGP